MGMEFGEKWWSLSGRLCCGTNVGLVVVAASWTNVENGLMGLLNNADLNINCGYSRTSNENIASTPQPTWFDGLSWRLVLVIHFYARCCFSKSSLGNSLPVHRMEVERTEVVICGCGPTGAMLSAYLGKRGIRNIVLERELEITQDPRGIALDEDGIRLLQGLGLYNDIFSKIGQS